MTGKIWLSEYGDATAGGFQAMQAPAVVVQVPITSTGSSQSFNAFNGATRIVRVHCDAGGPVCIKFGTPPITATTSDERWAPNQTEARVVRPGDTIAIITSLT